MFEFLRDESSSASGSSSAGTHTGTHTGTMSFGDHLQELRGRVFKALIVPVPLAIVLFFYAPIIREILIAPLFSALRANGQVMQIQALSPAETISTDMKLAFITAISLAAPWVLYQLWKFIEPGLYLHERRYVYFLVPLSAVLTACGIALFYWILLPFTLMFLVNFGASQPRKVPLTDPTVATAVDPNVVPAVAVIPNFPILDEDPLAPKPGDAWISSTDQVLRVAVPMKRIAANAVVELSTQISESITGPAEDPAHPTISILEIPLTVLGGISQIYRLSEYISFTLMLLLGSVIAFQMPVVILLLGWVGFISPKFLREKRRWAVLIMAIIAALVTPPDVTSMLLLLGPLLFLFEFGILLLVLVPAHKVAQGRVFSVGPAPAEAAQAAQTNRWGWGSSESNTPDLPSRRSIDDDEHTGSGSS